MFGSAASAARSLVWIAAISIVLSAGIVACGTGGSAPKIAVTAVEISPNPSALPTSTQAANLRVVWQIETNRTFTAGLQIIPEAAADDTFVQATTQAYVDCSASCLSGRYEIDCTLSIAADAPTLRELRCAGEPSVRYAPGRYRYRAAAATISEGLNARLASDEVFGVIEFR